MRMRKKKNLERRLSECGDRLITVRCDDPNFDVESTKERISLTELFGNDRPVELEIGCGKGQFACELAARQPEVNLLAVEKMSNVIVQGCERAERRQIPNLKFMCVGAEYLARCLPEHSVGRIYLNFSCPFPKKRYASHRLTSERFLKIYKTLLKDGGDIIQKTDNRALFEFSIEQLSSFGFTIRSVSLDLHNSDITDNIMTEYESKFVAMGMPIYRLEAYIKPQ